MDLSVVIPTLNESANITELLTELKGVLKSPDVDHETIVVDGGSRDGTGTVALQSGIPVQVIRQAKPGYGQALREGFKVAKGDCLLMLDANLSHSPTLIPQMWQARNASEMIIASRYIPGGAAEMPLDRRVASRLLNAFFGRSLSLPIHDLSSVYRLYRVEAVENLKLQATNFDVLTEIAVRAFSAGWKVTEVPLRYRPRKQGKSKAKLVRFGLSFLRTFGRMWKLRNSIESADYDDRAYDGLVPSQRYWQRRRYDIVTRFADKAGFTLDIGCGSSRIIAALTPLVGLEILLPKLRYARKFGKPLVNGSIWALPFANARCDCVVCSEVIEHIPAGDLSFLEMNRVLKPSGRLVVGTPDYDPLWWRMFEAAYRIAAPGGYADEHITHYTKQSLTELLNRLGFKVNRVEYILNSEMIFECTKTNHRCTRS